MNKYFMLLCVCLHYSALWSADYTDKEGLRLLQAKSIEEALGPKVTSFEFFELSEVFVDNEKIHQLVLWRNPEEKKVDKICINTVIEKEDKSLPCCDDCDIYTIMFKSFELVNNDVHVKKYIGKQITEKGEITNLFSDIQEINVTSQEKIKIKNIIQDLAKESCRHKADSVKGTIKLTNIHKRYVITEHKT